MKLLEEMSRHKRTSKTSPEAVASHRYGYIAYRGVVKKNDNSTGAIEIRGDLAGQRKCSHQVQQQIGSKGAIALRVALLGIRGITSHWQELHRRPQTARPEITTCTLCLPGWEAEERALARELAAFSRTRDRVRLDLAVACSRWS
jgi:hypothetical protein